MERRNGFIRSVQAGGPEVKPKERKPHRGRPMGRNVGRGNGVHGGGRGQNSKTDTKK